ncbi:MAG TPA: pyridoxamine 5'-phosphate oxidase family protein [Pseudonocardia sp.]|jgi:nitroimidazol reductase NimA-like FMN-containing flavoprotein (pyridoxamine 5'-phosphate oxidase superfamily)|nr:pyridoxamine 5'-phosphate oxidase family protein [Pseudonocardia sp.]
MAAMSKAERERYLAEPRVGALSVARPDGPPLVLPVWYRYEPGGEVVVQTGPESLKFRLLDAAREFSLLVQHATPPYKYVSVAGPIVAIEPETSAEDLESMARRYFDGEALAGYLKSLEGSTVATLRMRPERWNSTDFS